MKKPCPSCQRKVFTRRDMLYAPIDCTAHCHACGRTACLDPLSRWVLSCAIALILANVLLYGGFFYSGHLFLISMVVIFGVWRLLSAFAFPYLALEAMPESSPFDRTKNRVAIGVLLAAGMAFDSFLASRFDVEDALENARAPSAVNRER